MMAGIWNLEDWSQRKKFEDTVNRLAAQEQRYRMDAEVTALITVCCCFMNPEKPLPLYH